MNKFAESPNDEREEFFIECGARMGLSPQIVEKDFWVCWILKKLFTLKDAGPTLIFKGGTSLSKAYGLIKRFSEDIDVSIDRRSLGFGSNDCDPEAEVSNTERKRRIERLKGACQQKITKDLLPAMFDVIRSIIGDALQWDLVMDEDDRDGQTLLSSTLRRQERVATPTSSLQ